MKQKSESELFTYLSNGRQMVVMMVRYSSYVGLGLPKMNQVLIGGTAPYI